MNGDVVRRSDRLDEALNQADVPAALKALGAMGRRHRLFIRLLAVSLLFDLVLSGTLGFVAVRADHTAHVATSNRTAVFNSCIAGNETRAGQLTLWNHILDITPVAPARGQQYGEFRRFVADLFAPRDCKHPRTTSTSVPATP